MPIRLPVYANYSVNFLRTDVLFVALSSTTVGLDLGKDSINVYEWVGGEINGLMGRWMER